MVKTVFGAALLGIAVWGLATGEEIADPYASLEHHSFEQEGTTREYFVHVPPGVNGEMPVVFAIHGYTSTATGFAVFHDLRSHANENNYIVVYPQGTHFPVEGPRGASRITSWNMLAGATPEPGAGPQCTAEAFRYPCPPECGTCDRCGWASCYDDVGYFTRLLDDVMERYDTDTDRYYALGMSNGGMMALRLGCSMSERFAAIAPIDAQMPGGFDCEPTTNLPMIHLAGGLDTTVRPDGQPSSDGFIYVSAEQTAATWARSLQCDAGPSTWETSLTIEADLECTAYSDCAIAGQKVVSCVDPGETHNWPARRPGGAWPTCVTSQQKKVMPEQQLCAAREEYGPHLGMDIIWNFFAEYSK